MVPHCPSWLPKTEEELQGKEGLAGRGWLTGGGVYIVLHVTIGGFISSTVVTSEKKRLKKNEQTRKLRI